MQQINSILTFICISEHPYAMPSTVESLGNKLAETRKSMAAIIRKNAVLEVRQTQLKKKVKNLQEALKGTVL